LPLTPERKSPSRKKFIKLNLIMFVLLILLFIFALLSYLKSVYYCSWNCGLFCTFNKA